MAGYTYNRARYYTRSQHLSDQRDDIKTILDLKTQVNNLTAQVKHLESEVARLERELASRG